MELTLENNLKTCLPHLLVCRLEPGMLLKFQVVFSPVRSAAGRTKTGTCERVLRHSGPVISKYTASFSTHSS